jgi:flavin reductase (DIM6/NTAB) family NADH-FMN oxidoreductase RutF
VTVFFDMSALDAAVRYRLMASTIVPRPIAWVTTRNAAGQANTAPFSCFAMMGSAPPLVVIGMQARPDGRDKDSLANARATGELVVNLVGWHDGAAMAITAGDYDSGVDEAALAGLELLPATTVGAPRIASAPVSLECTVSDIIATGEAQTLLIARIEAMHVAQGAVLDAARGAIDTPALRLLGRMEGPAWYTRCEGREQFPITDPGRPFSSGAPPQ